jgi:hypothetical protein
MTECWRPSCPVCDCAGALIKSEELQPDLMGTMSPMAEKILELVTSYKHVTFAELDRKIEGFSGGNLEIGIDNEQASNIILWQGLTEEAVDALEELRQAKKIHQIPTIMLTYLVDGKALRLPLVKRPQHYKEPHWAPVCFNPGPAPEHPPKPPRRPPSPPQVVASRKAARAFASLNGWSQTEKAFSFLQLAGLGRKRSDDLMPACTRGDQDPAGVLDHLYWFKQNGKPVAIITMPYSYRGELAAAEKLAEQYGLIVAAPPIRESGWHLPGPNGTRCYAFVRPGTTVKWLPEQSEAAAFENWLPSYR